jgi:hypothetical protein
MIADDSPATLGAVPKLRLTASSCVDHCGDEHLSRLRKINDPVAVRDKLANAIVIELGHLSLGQWKFAQGLRERDDSSDYCVGVGGESEAM